jgi:hypothetical protein
MSLFINTLQSEIIRVKGLQFFLKVGGYAPIAPRETAVMGGIAPHLQEKLKSFDPY